MNLLFGRKAVVTNKSFKGTCYKGVLTLNDDGRKIDLSNFTYHQGDGWEYEMWANEDGYVLKENGDGTWVLAECEKPTLSAVLNRFRGDVPDWEIQQRVVDLKLWEHQYPEEGLKLGIAVLNSDIPIGVLFEDGLEFHDGYSLINSFEFNARWSLLDIIWRPVRAGL